MHETVLMDDVRLSPMGVPRRFWLEASVRSKPHGHARKEAELTVQIRCIDRSFHRRCGEHLKRIAAASPQARLEPDAHGWSLRIYRPLGPDTFRIFAHRVSGILADLFVLYRTLRPTGS